uniref:DUF4005 domain-containing protein n=1 Tax=Setaria digitata TaxID=48799 RepID=A0A915PH75_9BILA
MVCNETDEPIPFPSGFIRKTYPSIRCSRQTQRTQLESVENRNFDEQQQNPRRQKCSTINEGYPSTIHYSFGTKNDEQRTTTTGIGSCIFVRGPTQLRDSRRKTAERWQSKKVSKINDENCLEEIRIGQKVKFSPAAANNSKSFFRNLKNIMENKEHSQISNIEHFEGVRTYFLPSRFSSSAIGLKSTSYNLPPNYGTIQHSSLHRTKSTTKSTDSYFKSSEIPENISGQNQNIHGYAGALKELNHYHLPLRKKPIISRNTGSSDETGSRQRVASFSNLQGNLSLLK